MLLKISKLIYRILLGLVFISVVFIALFLANGYRWNFEEGEILITTIIDIDHENVLDLDVYLDGKLVDKKIPALISGIELGEHKIELKKGENLLFERQVLAERDQVIIVPDVLVINSEYEQFREVDNLENGYKYLFSGDWLLRSDEVKKEVLVRRKSEPGNWRKLSQWGEVEKWRISGDLLHVNLLKGGEATIDLISLKPMNGEIWRFNGEYVWKMENRVYLGSEFLGNFEIKDMIEMNDGIERIEREIRGGKTLWNLRQKSGNNYYLIDSGRLVLIADQARFIDFNSDLGFVWQNLKGDVLQRKSVNSETEILFHKDQVLNDLKWFGKTQNLVWKENDLLKFVTIKNDNLREYKINEEWSDVEIVDDKIYFFKKIFSSMSDEKIVDLRNGKIINFEPEKSVGIKQFVLNFR